MPVRIFLTLVTLFLISPGLSGQSFTDDFESGYPGAWVGSASHAQVAGAAHGGSFGVRGSGGWMHNLTPTVNVGDKVSIWTRYSGGGTRTYLGFDATAAGCKSFVFAPNTGDIRFQNNPAYGYTELLSMPVALSPGQWYRMEVELQAGGNAAGRIFDSTGTGLLYTLNYNYGSFTPGGVALRAGFTGTHDADDLLVGNPANPTCAINMPAASATVMGPIDIDFDVDDPQMDPLAVFFEFSTDAGATWLPMTALPGSPYVNPTLGQTTPATGLVFSWDSVADSVGRVAPAATSLRITVDDSANQGTCGVDVTVDNVYPTPTCIVDDPLTTVFGVWPFTYMADSLSAPTVDILFEYSSDGGVTFQTATPGSGTNPVLGVPTGAGVFDWDSDADSVASGMIETDIVLRLTVDDGLAPINGMCETAQFTADNTRLCNGVCGDCDLSGAAPVTIIDSLTSAQIAVSLIIPTPEQTGCCDVNSSGAIDVVDALFMAQSAAGLPAMLSCP